MLTKLTRHFTVCGFIVNVIANEANIQITKSNMNEKDYVKQHEITRFLKPSHHISTLGIPVVKQFQEEKASFKREIHLIEGAKCMCVKNMYTGYQFFSDKSLTPFLSHVSWKIGNEYNGGHIP